MFYVCAVRASFRQSPLQNQKHDEITQQANNHHPLRARVPTGRLNFTSDHLQPLNPAMSQESAKERRRDQPNQSSGHESCEESPGHGSIVSESGPDDNPDAWRGAALLRRLPDRSGAWTRKAGKHKLKPMLGLTHQWSRKLSPVV